MPTPFIDLSGQTFGKLTAIRQVESHPSRGRQWFCECSCGGEKIVSSSNLRSGAVKSCGCLHRKRVRPHGVWSRLKAKCYYSGHRVYKYFGGRGIGMAPEWLDYRVFRQWAEETGYAKGLFLVRRDRDKDFTPENCFWSPTRPRHATTTITNRAVIRSDGKRFSSLAEAVRETKGTFSSSLTAVCRGRRKTHAGFGWRYADETDTDKPKGT